MIPKGIIIDCSCVLLGTNLGSVMKDRVPERIKQPMNIIFGIAAITIGLTSVIRLQSLPAVILALILGALTGELTGLDGKVNSLFQAVLEKLNFKITGDKDEYMRFYLIVAVTFCASGTNIFGAISEGITGDFTILLSKAVMDIFAATIFATTLGRAMNVTVILQFLILCLCFYSARFIMPLTTEAMLNDFIAMGGLLTFVLGLSIAQIKHISAVNLLPSLILIWPCSWVFGVIV
ncbi:MAG: DUF554 domain-containing protein [Clostridium sp.]|nr:DUF554 domain-containing protein [Clostridium sp.]